ncbi:MAG TPA: hypothetical protein VK684_11980 [Edaphobacter sp.]|jgi:hypothetical protein|nr:hypothetical protein [Edaphobacter sp.]
MMMLEDLRLALRQICQAIGLQGNAATVVSLIVLGVALNLVALRAVEFVGIGGHTCHDRTALQSATQTELKVVRTVVVSTLKKIGDTGRRLCLAQQWMIGEQIEGTRHHYEAGSSPAPSTSGGGCDVAVVSRSSRKMTIARVQC